MDIMYDRRKQLEIFSKKLWILSSWQLKLKNVHIIPLGQ